MATAATIAAAAAADGHGEPEVALALRRDAALRCGCRDGLAGVDGGGLLHRRRVVGGGALGGLPLGAADGLELVHVHRLRLRGLLPQLRACCWAACCAAARCAASYAARWSAGAAGCGGVNGLVGCACAGAAGSGCVWLDRQRLRRADGRQRLRSACVWGCWSAALRSRRSPGWSSSVCPPWSRYITPSRAGGSLRRTWELAASFEWTVRPAERRLDRRRRPRPRAARRARGARARSTRTSTTLRPGPGAASAGSRPSTSLTRVCRTP